MSSKNFALVIGACCIAVGVILFILNISGVTDLTVEAGPIKGALAKGTPGALLVFVGTIIMLAALFKKEKITKIGYQTPDESYNYTQIVRRIRSLEPAEALKAIDEQISALEELKKEIEKK